MVKDWLKWTTYTLLAILAIAFVISAGTVFLIAGVIVGLIVLGVLLVGFVAYLIKEFWEHVISSR